MQGENNLSTFLPIPPRTSLRPRSPSSQSGASRIEWKFDFSCREWMDCLVECKQLGSAGSMWCNMFSGRQQTRARKRVLNRTLHSNTQDTLQGGTRFFIRVWGLIVHYGRRNRRRLAPGWFHCERAGWALAEGEAREQSAERVEAVPKPMRRDEPRKRYRVWIVVKTVTSLR